MPTGNNEILEETTQITEATTEANATLSSASINMQNIDDDNKDNSSGNNDTNGSNNDLKGQICGTKLPTGTFDPTPYIQRARVTRPAPPKPSCNPMQFVQIKPCNLYQSAQEQIKRAEEVKKVKEVKKEDPEDWQNNLDNWKSSRRKRVEHIIDRVVEVKKLELEEHDRSRRKSKTFSEMLEERTTKGRTNKLASLAVYTEDESNDLSDLGIGTSSTSGKSSLSEDYDNNSVLSDNADTEKTPTNFKSDNNSNDGDLSENGGATREYISSPGYDTSSSTAPASSPDPCEYTYEGAIEDYKSRISKAVASSSKNSFNNNINNNNNNITNTNNNNNNMNSNANIYRNNKDSTIPERTLEQYLPRRMSGTKIEDRLMNFEIKSSGDANESISTSNISKKDLPKVDILKRRELFEKENSPSSSSNDTPTKERRFSGATAGADIQNTKTIRERLSSLEKKPSLEEDNKKKVNRLSGDITSIKNRLQNLEQNNNQIVDNNTTSSDKGTRSLATNKIVDVPVLSLKDRLSSLQSAVAKEEIKKPVMLIDEHQLEILKKEDFEKQQALKRISNISSNTSSTTGTTPNTIITINTTPAINTDDEQHSNSSHEILSIPDESNVDTDREDSGIHTTDVSCSVSQTDEQAELVNEENHHQHPINIDNLHHHHHHHDHEHHNNLHQNNNDHPEHNSHKLHSISNNATIINDTDKTKLSLEIVDQRNSTNDQNILSNQNKFNNAVNNSLESHETTTDNDVDISVSEFNTPKSESPSHSSSISSSSQTTIFDSKNNLFGDGKNINLINNQNHNILLANVNGNNLEGVGTSHNIDLITKNKTINSCNQVVVDLTNSCNASNNKLLTTPSKVSSYQNCNVNCIDSETGRYIICIINPNNIGNNNINKTYLPKNSPNTIIQNDNNFDLQSKSKFDLTPQNSPIILCDATDNKNIQPSFSPNTNTDNAQTPTIITKEVSTSNCNKSPNLERKETIEEISCNKIDIHNLAPSVKLSTPCIEVSLEDIAKCEKKVSNLDPYNTYNLELKNPSPTPSEAFDQIIASCLTDSSTRSSMISDIDIVNTNSNLQHNQKPSNYERCKSIEEILCDKIDIKNLPPSVHLSTTCIDINEDDIKKIEKNQSNLIENPINSPEKQIVKSPETASDILDQILLSNLPDYKPNPKNDNNKIQTKIFENSKISAQSPITVEIPNDGVQKTSEPCPFSPNTMRKLSGIESLMSILNQESELNKSSPTSPSTPLTPQINILDYKSKKSPLSPTTSGVNPLSPISPSSETENFNFSLTKQSQPTTPIEIPKALEMSPTLTKKPPVSPTSPIAIRRGLYQNTQNNKQAVPPSPPKFLYSSKPIAAPRRCPMISDLEEHAGSKTAFIGSPPKSPCETSQTNKSAIFSIGPMQPGAYKNITLLKSEEIPQIRKVSFKEPDTTANITVKSSSGAVNKIRKPVQPAVEKTQNILTDCSLADIENQIIIEKPMPSNTPIPPPRNASSLYKISSAAQNSHNITSPNIQIPINMEKPLNISVNAGESLQKNSPMISPKPKVPPKPDHLKNSPIPLKRSIRPENLDLSTRNQTCNENVSSPTQSTNSGNSTPKTPGVLVAKLEVVETTIKVTSNDNSPQSRPMSPTSIQSSTTTSSSSLPSSPILNRSPLFNKKTHPNYTKTNTNNNSSNSKPKNIFEFIKKNFNNTNENENESDFNLDDKIVVDNSKFYISSDDIGDSTSSSTNISCRSHSDLNNDRDDIDDSNSSNSITICSNQYHQHLPSQQQTNEVNIEIKKIIKTEKIIEKTDNLSPDSNLTAEINQIIDEGIAKLTCDDTKL